MNIGRMMPNERGVDREERRILKHLSTLPYTFGGYEDSLTITTMALKKLESQGYVRSTSPTSGLYELTPAGWMRSEQVRLGPIRYWFKENWIPTAISFILALASLGLGIWNVLQAS